MSNDKDNDKRWGDFIPTKSKKWNLSYPKESTFDTIKIVDGVLSDEKANEVKSKVVTAKPKYSLEERRQYLYSPLKIRDNPYAIDNSLISLIHDLVTKDFIRIIGVTPYFSVKLTATEITFGRKDKSYNITMVTDPFDAENSTVNLAGHYPDYLEFDGDILLEWIYNNIELYKRREDDNNMVVEVDKLGKFLLENKYVFFYSSSSSIQDMRFAEELQEEFFQEEEVVEKKLNPTPQKIEIETELKEEIEVEIKEDDPIKKKEDIIDKLHKAAEEISFHTNLWNCRNYMLFPSLCSTGCYLGCPFYVAKYKNPCDSF